MGRSLKEIRKMNLGKPVKLEPVTAPDPEKLYNAQKFVQRAFRHRGDRKPLEQKRAWRKELF